MRQEKTSFNLTPNTKEVLKRLARYYGISQSAALALIIRKDARSQGLNIEDLQDEDEEGNSNEKDI